MKTVCLANFNGYYCNALVDLCMRKGQPIDAIICVGDRPNFTDRRIFWEYTDFAEGLHLTDLAKYAIPVYIVKELNSKDTLKALEKTGAELILQAGAGIIKKDILDHAPKGVLNSHPGLLPHYRGCMAVEWSIFNDDPVGATCHFVDEGIDSGPIVCSRPMPVRKDMDYHSLRYKVFFHQIDVMVEGIRKVREGLRPQDAQPQTGGNYNKPMDEQGLEKVKNILRTQSYGHYEIL